MSFAKNLLDDLKKRKVQFRRVPKQEYGNMLMLSIERAIEIDDQIIELKGLSLNYDEKKIAVGIYYHLSHPEYGKEIKKTEEFLRKYFQQLGYSDYRIVFSYIPTCLIASALYNSKRSLDLIRKTRDHLASSRLIKMIDEEYKKIVSISEIIYDNFYLKKLAELTLVKPLERFAEAYYGGSRKEINYLKSLPFLTLFATALVVSSIFRKIKK